MGGEQRPSRLRLLPTVRRSMCLGELNHNPPRPEEPSNGAPGCSERCLEAGNSYLRDHQFEILQVSTKLSDVLSHVAPEAVAKIVVVAFSACSSLFQDVVEPEEHDLCIVHLVTQSCEPVWNFAQQLVKATSFTRVRTEATKPTASAKRAFSCRGANPTRLSVRSYRQRPGNPAVWVQVGKLDAVSKRAHGSVPV